MVGVAKALTRPSLPRAAGGRVVTDLCSRLLPQSTRPSGRKDEAGPSRLLEEGRSRPTPPGGLRRTGRADRRRKRRGMKGDVMPDQSPFIWHELVTPDQQASGEFFRELLGWTSRAVDAGPFGIYTLFQEAGHDVAGMMNPTGETPVNESFWHSYIAVGHVDECARRVPSLGGTVLVPPHDVPDFGRVCAVADATGAVAHLVQPLGADAAAMA